MVHMQKHGITNMSYLFFSIMPNALCLFSIFYLIIFLYLNVGDTLKLVNVCFRD